MEKTAISKDKVFRIKEISSVNSMVKIAFLSVIAYIIMLFEFPIPFFPPFLQIDLSDLPALIGSFALGPIAGIFIELIKNLLHLITKTNTGGVGELANFLVGIALVIPAGLCYSIKRKRSYALSGMLIGTLFMALVGALVNYFILLPFYAKMMPIEAIINMGTAVNSAITDLKTLVLYAMVPFNILKGFVVSVLTILLYKRISPLITK